MFMQKSKTNLTLVAVALGLCVGANAVSITGAGASFPAPVYAKWAASYQQDTKNKVNYQSIGSSSGIKQIIKQTVDFGASDAPLADERLAKENLFQFPAIIGGVVLAVNLDGIKAGELVLDGKTLADIYLGKITKWNDPAIAKLNPNSKLPDQDIAVIRRADGSGTSFVFTSYLSKVSPEWKEKIGANTIVKWAVGLGGKGNEGVSAFIQRINGSIGYIEYAYAKQNNLPYLRLFSKDNQVVSPSAESFSAAAVKATWEKSFAQDLTYQAGDNAWPITTASFILVPQKSAANQTKTKDVLNFFKYNLEKGGKIAADLDYAPLPKNVVEIIEKKWSDLTDASGKKVYP